MKAMKERTALGEAILKHWREHCPQMVRDLEKHHRLDQAVFETQEMAGDLLYELMSERKMDYQAAWEMVREQWALPPGEESPSASGKSTASTSTRNPRRRATSE